MPAPSRSSALALILTLAAAPPAHAAGGVTPEELFDAVRGYIQQISQDPRPKPQALPAADPGGPSIDIADLSQQPTGTCLGSLKGGKCLRGKSGGFWQLRIGLFQLAESSSLGLYLQMPP